MAVTNTYSKTFSINIEVDKSSLEIFQKDINNTLKSIQSDSKDSTFKAFSGNATKEYTEIQSNLKKLESLKLKISKISLLGDTKENREMYNAMLKAKKDLEASIGSSSSGSIATHDANRKLMFSEIKTKAIEVIKAIGVKLSDTIKSVVTDAFSSITDMASYNLSSSLTINSAARQQALKYGLSDSENYAFSRVKSEMGISSDEDLFYMNEAQQERFAERMGYYSNKYDELQQSGLGQSIQEFQIEFSEFKEEMTMGVAKFFVDNKETIKSVLQGAMKAFEAIITAVGWLSKFFGNSTSSSTTEQASTANEILKNVSSIVNKTNNNNVNMSPSYNFYGNENASKIEETQRMLYEQLYAAYNQ